MRAAGRQLGGWEGEGIPAMQATQPNRRASQPIAANIDLVLGWHNWDNPPPLPPPPSEPSTQVIITAHHGTGEAQARTGCKKQRQQCVQAAQQCWRGEEQGGRKEGEGGGS